MTPERFEALAEAYGGDIARWPQAEQAAALALAGSAQARAALAEAARLDARLADYAVAAPSGALMRKIAASATAGPVWRRAQLWWSGLGLVAVAAAGGIAGALAVSVAAPANLPAAEPAYEQTAFGDIASQELSE
jgi:hypothetical protein